MLRLSQANPELRADIERIERDSHSQRSADLYELCVQTMRRAAVLRDDAGFILVAKQFAVVIDQRGHPDEGVDLLLEALERARIPHWFVEQAELLVLIGRVYYARADYIAALEAWTEAIEVAQRAGDLVSWGWAKLGIGQICDALDSPTLAVTVFDELGQALNAAPPAEADTARLAKLRLYTHLNLGVNHQRLGQLDAALAHCMAGLRLAQELNIRDEQGEALLRLGEITWQQGQTEQALAHLDEAQCISTECAFFWALANIHHLRARILSQRGERGAALREIGLAHAESVRSGARHITARVLQTQSTLAESSGDLSLALAALRQAVDLHRQIDHNSKSATLRDIEDLTGIRHSPDRKLLMLSSHPLLEADDWPRAAQLLCDEGRLVLNVDRVVYWRVGPSALFADHASGQAGIPTRRIDQTTVPALWQRLQAGEAVLAHTAKHHQDTWPLQVSYLGPHDVQALLAYPVQVAGETAGVFFFEQIGKRRNWGRDAAVLANQLAMMAGRCLSQAARRTDQQRIRSLNEQLRQANQDLEMRIERRTSELRAAMKALELSRAEAERNARVKGEFLAHMSHEIRTPLNGVLGLAQLGLQQTDGQAQAREAFSGILDSGQLLLGIINDILDFSKIDAGMVKVEAVPVDLQHVVEQCIRIVAERARQKNIQLAAELAPGLPRWCCGDPLRMGQILMNLLANAIKFTEAGHVKVRLFSDEGWLALQVQDTGIGIAPDRLLTIFRPFQQADNSTTREFGGTGLGLTITRRLVELMGGEIAVQSAPGAGSSFVVRLPHVLLDAAAQGAAGMGSVLPAGALKGRTVLVAEDNEVNQIVVERMLVLAGMHVTLVGNGRDAVDQVRANPGAFDAVLMDIQMPEMDGYEATRRLRALAPQLPIIGLTAHALAEDRALCLDTGMVDHVAKPIVHERLLEALFRHVARQAPQ